MIDIEKSPLCPFEKNIFSCFCSVIEDNGNILYIGVDYTVEFKEIINNFVYIERFMVAATGRA